MKSVATYLFLISTAFAASGVASAQSIIGPGLNGSSMKIFESDNEYNRYLTDESARNTIAENGLDTINDPALENAHFQVVTDQAGNPVTAAIHGSSNIRRRHSTAQNVVLIMITDGPYAQQHALLSLEDEQSIEGAKMSASRAKLVKINAETAKHDADYATIHGASFAGIKLGLSLKDTFDLLAQQGYADLRERGEAYSYRTFKYGISCPKGADAAICQVYGNHDYLMEMEFTKKDSHGNTYRVIIDFTRFYMTGAQSALAHARVNRINGFIGMKGPMTDADYQQLADDKYGKNHNVVLGNPLAYSGNDMGNDWNGNRVCTCLYTDVSTANYDNEPHKVLRVTIEDEQTREDIDQGEVSRDIERRRKAAVKPQF